MTYSDDIQSIIIVASVPLLEFYKLYHSKTKFLLKSGYILECGQKPLQMIKSEKNKSRMKSLNAIRKGRRFNRTERKCNLRKGASF